MKNFLTNSLLARTTVLVLGISFLVGSLFSGLAYIYFLQAEQERAVSYTAGLLDTVEDTMQIACYLSDRNLAKDVVDGIGKRKEVKSIRISNSKAVLAEFHRKNSGAVTALPDWLVPGTGQINKTIYSPFNLREPVCQASIELSQPEIRNHSNRNAGFIAALLLIEMIVLSVVAGGLILLMVVRPIQKISRGLHRLNAEQGQQLPALSSHRYDELGTLIDDINLLIIKLVALISKERALKTEHEKGELKLRTIFEKAETGIFQLNDSGEILASNPAFRRMLALPEHLSHAPDALLRLMEGQELRLHLMIYQATHQQQTMAEDFCIEPEQSGGQKKWIHLVVHSASEGVLQGLINDVTERKRQEEQAQRLAVTDHLTGLNNRLGFEREIQRLHKEHLANNGQPFVLMMIDLDQFKQVNDTLGHHAGDQVLRHFATLLNSVLRKTDFTARLGGDEFVALLKDVHEYATAQKVAEKILSLVAEPVMIEDSSEARIGASIGICFADQSAFDIQELMNAADDAMYTVKQSGRNGFHLRILNPPESVPK
ncbi:sensor domain-containing diguanylate cyclase [Undibacterium squillarum]|uniref:Diguanylate cyclase n=1 Tax=Undibacterium squillarum TaxID=1131567 RepID=A0ABQ2XRB2_9BURK|nr:sensor domain-containing diguanylate cyclase [Undibacterium squillarum]GGX29435.1 hypothetical protein GCM10010946_02910 [Undibacterium squillarum]